MVMVKSKKHQITVSIPMSCGSEKAVEMYAAQIDEAVTKLIEKCTEDKRLVSEIEFAKHREDGIRLVAKHLKCATGHAPWLRAWVGPTICEFAFEAITTINPAIDTPACS